MQDTAGLSLDVATLRQDFPILGQTVHGDRPLVYLDNAATTQHPRQVIQAIVAVYEHDYANVHRGIHTLSERSTALYTAAREKVRDFIHAGSADEIIFTRGATESINLVARSWGDAFVQAGDEILLTEMEHHSNLVPWQQLAARRGAKLRHIPITDEGLLDLTQLPSLLNERTRMVAVTAISNVLGTINPLQQIIAAAHDAGALVLVDAAQGVPHFPYDVQALGADFFAFSAHKMVGPSGVGVLYGRRELLDRMPPFQGGGSMISRVTLDSFEPAELPAKFEAGTPPIVPAIGLGAAIDYLTGIGLGAIHEHELRLARAAHEGLNAHPAIRFLGPAPDKKSGIVSFVVEGVPEHDVAQLLDRQGVAVRASHHCARPLHEKYGLAASVRASFYLYNTLGEVDALVAGIERVQHLFRADRPRRRRKT